MTITTGYKATDENMKCRGLQFVLGEWQEVEGELIECENGLHFCTELAHTYEFYNNDTDRRFECEVDGVLEIQYTPGVINKRVARRIRLIKELSVTGDSNTGNQNTGNQNTGHRNTGNQNTGNWNTGNWNTGHRNTGHRNTGHQNTGNQNTGNQNTGNWNTGHQNTGNQNTGYRNTGNQNTGHRNTEHQNTGNWNTGNQNTGNWNICDCSTGFFGSIDPKITSFDIECEYTRGEFIDKFASLCQKLHNLMQKDDPIDVEKFLAIPNITQDRLNNLHQKYIDSRNSSD